MRSRTPKATTIVEEQVEERETLYEHDTQAHHPVHMNLKPRQRIIVAITFFSMFFGAGNLIFPPLVGALAGRATLPAMIGFIISAVGLPILGVLVVVRAGGFHQLGTRVSPRFPTILGVAIMLTIGPLFAIPRTASTSFEMAVAPFTTDHSRPWAQLIYSIIFFALAFLVAQHPDKLTNVLGKIMGPLLLVMIVILFVVCVFLPHPSFSAPSGVYDHQQLLQGFIDGYQTMDLLCALYFGIVISANVAELGVTDEARNRLETGLAGASTGVMLILVYSALAFVGMVSGSIIPVDSTRDTGATVLTNLVQHTFGQAGSIFIGCIFIIACFNVCSGLIATVSSYFHGHFPRLASYRVYSIVFTLIALVIANIGLNTIIQLAVPVLSSLYPIAIALVLLSLLPRNFTQRFRFIYPWAIGCTAVVSIANGICTLMQFFGIHLTWLEAACALLPLHSISLGWLLPALCGVCIGIIVTLVQHHQASNNGK